MARLNNTTSPRKREQPRRILKSPTKTDQRLSESPSIKIAGDNNGGQWSMTSATRSTNSSTSGTLNLTGASSTRKQAQKTGKKKNKKRSDGDFQIFNDSDALVEREAEETEDEDERSSPAPSLSPFSASASSSSSSTGTFPSYDEYTKDPLRLARVNSLLPPLSQQARSRRPTRKSELEDYAKENDPIEELEEDDNSSNNNNNNDDGSYLTRSSSDASSRRSPVRRNARQTQQSSAQFSTYQQREMEEEASGDSEDKGFDSLDDFIVSDDEVSYQEPSGSETEAEEIPSPPVPKPRRRLVRGRRPAPKPETESDSEPEKVEEVKRSQEVPSYKEQSPIGNTPPSLKSDSKHTQLSENGFNITDELNHLDLEDNASSCQLAKELNGVVTGLDSPFKISPASKQPKPQTPPSSPSKSNHLRSPTKERIRIPPTPYRESADAFWSQETTNDWVDQHSPSKLDQLLREFEDSDSDNDKDSEKLFDIRPRNHGTKKEPKAPSKTAQKKAEIEHKKALVGRKKSFDDKKAAFGNEFLSVLDDAVAGGQVQEMTKETGGVHIIWSKTLQTTAGRATWKRVKITDAQHNSGSSGTYKSSKQHAAIELAERVIDNEDRLINTLAHEYCHLANMMISNVHNNPHGTSFKQWGLKCKKALQDHPVYAGRIEVTTKHSYKIDYKYMWTCVDCAQNYGRHSKSINPAQSRCGRCRGILQQIKPKPRNVSPTKKKQVAQGAPPSPVDKQAVDDVMQVLGGVSLH